MPKRNKIFVSKAFDFQGGCDTFRFVITSLSERHNLTDF